MQLGALRDKRLFEELILPSWLSGLFAITSSILLIAATVALTHFGNTVQQSALGLRQVYTQSPIGAKAIMVSDNFASNAALNNVLLFLLWGSVGLLVYSIVQAILTEFKRANNVIQELHYVNADRHTILQEAFIRETIKVVAFILFWLLFRYAIFKLTPYTIVTAHTLAVHPSTMDSWNHALLAAVLCMCTLHLLTVLLRLTLLRTRVFGTDINAIDA